MREPPPPPPAHPKVASVTAINSPLGLRPHIYLCIHTNTKVIVTATCNKSFVQELISVLFHAWWGVHQPSVAFDIVIWTLSIQWSNWNLVTKIIIEAKMKIPCVIWPDSYLSSSCKRENICTHFRGKVAQNMSVLTTSLMSKHLKQARIGNTR